MNPKIKQHKAEIKILVDNGFSLAEAFLKTFESRNINKSQQLFDTILQDLSAQDLLLGSDYFFPDGSRLNIDPYCDCMLATKGIRSKSHPNY
ncbi:hypothetical protein [Endozoicomonas sp. Mp262]|uniref:hypothetical protein n=1 Tax=Endozoicomonas sp. Mp262 TaxID=2919499 RepID=UPI0021D863F9